MKSETCPIYKHRHPLLSVTLRTRTRLLGTLNLAWAVRGRSCGWGSCQRPRRTFVGHNRVNRRSGHYFAEVVVTRAEEFGLNHRSRTVFHIGDRPSAPTTTNSKENA